MYILLRVHLFQLCQHWEEKKILYDLYALTILKYCDKSLILDKISVSNAKCRTSVVIGGHHIVGERSKSVRQLLSKSMRAFTPCTYKINSRMYEYSTSTSWCTYVNLRPLFDKWINDKRSGNNKRRSNKLLLSRIELQSVAVTFFVQPFSLFLFFLLFRQSYFFSIYLLLF